MALPPNPPGSVCWAELRSADHAAALPFYTALLDLDDADAGASFAFLRKGGADVGAVYTAPPGAAPGWLPYVAAASAVATVRRALAAGGTLMQEPRPVGDAGWSAVVADPEGTPLGVWEAAAHRGFALRDEPGAVCWAEVNTWRAGELGAFFGAAFGWGTGRGPARNYTDLQHDGATVAGMVQMDDTWGDVRPHWMVYFGVADLRQAIDEAVSLGGEAVFGPVVARGNRFAVLADPQGVTFSVVQRPAFGDTDAAPADAAGGVAA